MSVVALRPTVMSGALVHEANHPLSLLPQRRKALPSPKEGAPQAGMKQWLRAWVTVDMRGHHPGLTWRKDLCPTVQHTASSCQCLKSLPQWCSPLSQRHAHSTIDGGKWIKRSHPPPPTHTHNFILKPHSSCICWRSSRCVSSGFALPAS